ncbi:TPA: AAA family ATPase [Aeromonas dhakensis]|nr:AAA family ATPase [Aeromonas dhakensis]
MKIISLFNHKGGVSKTTTTFNLGWKLATMGHKVLVVDADPQCNLTALVLGYNSIGEMDDFYKNNPLCDIHSCIKPVIDGSLGKVIPAEPVQTPNKNLFLLCGNLELSEVETQISVSLTTSTAIPAIRNIPGSIGAFLRATADKHNFDYVIIDMSPSVGSLNECLLMSSNYFIVPTAPDFFCAQAIRSLTNVVPRWNVEINPFRDPSLIYPFPVTPPKFIGFISQKYRPRNGAPVKSFQKWIDVINNEVIEKLQPALMKQGMTVTKAEFTSKVTSDEAFNIANIADFNSLIAQSQKHNIPVFALDETQIEQTGTVLSVMTESRDNFDKTFKKLAKDVIALTM